MKGTNQTSLRVASVKQIVESNPLLFSFHMPPTLNLISSDSSKIVMFFLGEVGF